MLFSVLFKVCGHQPLPCPELVACSPPAPPTKRKLPGAPRVRSWVPWHDALSRPARQPMLWNRMYLFKSNFIAICLWSMCPQGTVRPLKGPGSFCLCWAPTYCQGRHHTGLQGGSASLLLILSDWPEVGGCPFPAFSWHGAQSQAQDLIREAQPHGGQGRANLLPPDGHLAESSCSGSWQAHSWGLDGESCPCPCDSPWGQGCPYPYSEVRMTSCTKFAYGLLDGVGLWPPF